MWTCSPTPEPGPLLPRRRPLGSGPWAWALEAGANTNADSESYISWCIGGGGERTNPKPESHIGVYGGWGYWGRGVGVLELPTSHFGISIFTLQFHLTLLDCGFYDTTATAPLSSLHVHCTEQRQLLSLQCRIGAGWPQTEAITLDDFLSIPWADKSIH